MPELTECTERDHYTRPDGKAWPFHLGELRGPDAEAAKAAARMRRGRDALEAAASFDAAWRTTLERLFG